MRKVKYQEYLTKRAGPIKKGLELEERRGVRRRPRSAVERELLLRLDKARFKNWKETGKLEIVGPHKYKFYKFSLE